jgi:hypothetical protein
MIVSIQGIGRRVRGYDSCSLGIMMLFLFIPEIKPSFLRLSNASVTDSLVAPTRFAIS